MFAIVKSGAIESTGTLNQLFPNTSFPGGVAPDSFKAEEGLEDIVQGEQKDIMYFDVNEQSASDPLTGEATAIKEPGFVSKAMYHLAIGG